MACLMTAVCREYPSGSCEGVIRGTPEQATCQMLLPVMALSNERPLRDASTGTLSGEQARDIGPE